MLLLLATYEKTLDSETLTSMPTFSQHVSYCTARRRKIVGLQRSRSRVHTGQESERENLEKPFEVVDGR